MQKMSLAQFLKQPKQKMSLEQFLSQPAKSKIASIPTLPPTLEQRIDNLGREQLSAEENLINNLGGGLVHGLLSSPVLNPLGTISTPTKGALFPQMLSTPPEAEATSPIYKAATIAGESVPSLIGGTAASESFLPFAGNVLKNALAGGVGGALFPAKSSIGVGENILSGAGLGALGGAGINALKGIGRIVKGDLPGSLAAMVSSAPDKISKNLVDNLTFNPTTGLNLTPEEMNSKLSQALVDNAHAAEAKGSSLFNNVLNKAESLGYARNVNIPIKSMLSEPFPGAFGDKANAPAIGTVKRIMASENTQNLFDSLLNDKTSLAPTPSVVKKLINNFQDNPSFFNAHQLQSGLNNMANKIDPKLSPGGYELKQALNDTRKNVLKDISNSLIANKDAGLHADFSAARKNWKNTVVPYQKAQITKSLLKGNDVKNVAEKLGKFQATSPKVSQNYQVLRNDIANNQNQLNVLAGALLSKGAIPEGANFVAPAKNVLSTYAKAPVAIKNMINPVIGDHMNALNSLYLANKGNVLPKLIKNAAKAGLIGLGLENVYKGGERLIGE